MSLKGRSLASLVHFYSSVLTHYARSLLQLSAHSLRSFTLTAQCSLTTLVHFYSSMLTHYARSLLQSSLGEGVEITVALASAVMSRKMLFRPTINLVLFELIGLSDLSDLSDLWFSIYRRFRVLPCSIT